MKHKLHKLSNGLRLIVIPMPSLESATLTIWVGTGSRNENDRISGLSHFLEHMVFKGGKKRTTAKEVSEAVDAIGGEFNAATSKEWTNFYIKARSPHLDIAFDVLADIVLTPLLRPRDIDREKGVIVEEIGMYEDTPLWKIDDLFENLIFKGSALGRDVIGTKDTVMKFKRADFASYRGKHYFPTNIVVTVSGGVDESKVLALTKKYFGQLRTSLRLRDRSDSRRSDPAAKAKPDFNKFSARQRKPQVLLSSKKKDQAHFILGFTASQMDSKERFAETLLATILGGGMSSRLFTEIREKRGLAYAVKASRDAYIDTGYIGVYAGVDPKKATEAVKVTLDQCYGISNKELGIKNQELTKAKEYIKGHVALGLEDTKAVNGFYGIRELLLGKIETPEQVYKAIDKVTADDVVSVAKKNFKAERLNLAIIGPYQDSKNFESLLK